MITVQFLPDLNGCPSTLEIPDGVRIVKDGKVLFIYDASGQTRAMVTIQAVIHLTVNGGDSSAATERLQGAMRSAT